MVVRLVVLWVSEQEYDADTRLLSDGNICFVNQEWKIGVIQTHRVYNKKIKSHFCVQPNIVISSKTSYHGKLKL